MLENRARPSRFGTGRVEITGIDRRDWVTLPAGVAGASAIGRRHGALEPILPAGPADRWRKAISRFCGGTGYGDTLGTREGKVTDVRGDELRTMRGLCVMGARLRTLPYDPDRELHGRAGRGGAHAREALPVPAAW